MRIDRAGIRRTIGPIRLDRTGRSPGNASQFALLVLRHALQWRNHSLTVVAPIRALRGCPLGREGFPAAPNHLVIRTGQLAHFIPENAELVRLPLSYTGSRAHLMTTSTLSTTGPFVNEPITDYRQPGNVRGMRQAIEEVRAQLGREYDLVIGGEPIRTRDKIISLNPANPSEVIGIHQKAGLEHVEPAMQAALAAFEKWQYASVAERTGVLF